MAPHSHKDNLNSIDIQFVKGVGPQRAKLFKNIGIKTVKDCLYYFPKRYEDRTNLAPISGIIAGQHQTVSADVVSARSTNSAGGLFRKGRGLNIVELHVSDGTGVLVAKWFNQPYLKNRFKQGQKIILSGVVKASRWGIEMDSPDYELQTGGEPLNMSRIVPVYRATGGLNNKAIRSVVYNVLREYAGFIEDPMPGEILLRLGLPALKDSIYNAHFPTDGSNMDNLNNWSEPYQRRLSFDELFMLEAGLASIKQGRGKEPGIPFVCAGGLVERYLSSLPFNITDSQKEAYYSAILPDMRAHHPMNRLLQGDVGSGKTVVAVMTMLTAVECGYQAAFMAPTEILAEQHFINLHLALDALGLRVCMVSSGVKKKPLADIQDGSIDIVVGTHALIEEKITFRKLGAVVIDEQHRFGVRQRLRLREKGGEQNPDVLIMTATPIPRTLSLTLYGDLDYTVMRHLPPGRTPVATEHFTEDKKQMVYGIILQELKRGGQVYVVYPVIEENENTGLRSAEKGADGLKIMLPGYKVGIMHGRMKPAEKESVMADFKAGRLHILVSTTVIEVGVDVPNASMMLIVHAERFGLSQLHQLRGRVGRGMRISRCLLLTYGELGFEAQHRISAMCGSTDGFKIAEEDLRLRGPGELFGTRQSGLPGLEVSDIIRDAELLDIARREAFNLIGNNPDLNSMPILKRALVEFWHGKAGLFKTG